MSYNSARGASKASANTTCQKCLKKGHYSYECKSAVQERPYTSRPSRSAQLMNPRLKTQLTNQAPEEPAHLVDKKGLADKILAEKAEERRRKRSIDRDEDMVPRKRNRSKSFDDSDSVSSISTNRSRSPIARNSKPNDDAQAGAKEAFDESRRSSGIKRARGTSSPSEDGMDGIEDKNGRYGDRNTRHRMRSVSPQERGRRRRRGSGSAHFSNSRSRSRNGRDRGYGRGTYSYDGAGDGKAQGRQRSLSPFSKRMAMSQDMKK
ncbi:zinc knuckle-domain-containing protein [Elsinoe ampelina]|uniref:Zinc knuckle-domain-containing protein n=1 Tax=Elsinoe ampelina TaxID=302913 RepID=A0A6A6GCF2_9PEZI|nr:zinc knuckle-domain-containing protein [Elsinoe ampelina]